jgi:hypothetical protein
MLAKILNEVNPVVKLPIFEFGGYATFGSSTTGSIANDLQDDL